MPRSAFVHKKDCGGKDLAVGQAVSFALGEGAKGASAKKVQEEEGGAAPVVEEEEEGEREFGKVKSYNEEKGFAFIVSGRPNFTAPAAAPVHTSKWRSLDNTQLQYCDLHDTVC